MPLSNRNLTFGALVAAVVGFVDATYLTLEHYLNKVPPCSIGGCEQVLTSRYATVLGVPVALAGVFFYVAVILVLVMAAMDRSRALLRWFGRLVVLGFLASVWLVFAQLFLIHAVCLYCLLSETMSTILFALGLVVLRRTSSE